MMRKHGEVLVASACAWMVLFSSNVACADVVGPYQWLNWQAAVSGQPVTTLVMGDQMNARGYVAGQSIPPDAFVGQFGLSFESSSSLARGVGPYTGNAVVVQSIGVSAAVRWQTLVHAAYYVALGQQQINFYRGSDLVSSIYSPYTETGFTSQAGFDRMEFVTKPDKKLEIHALLWVVPAPSASALLVLCGAAAPGRRRRA